MGKGIWLRLGLRIGIIAYLSFLCPTWCLDIPCPHDKERGHLLMEAHVEKHFPISIRESLATISPGLRNGCRRPAGMVQFHIRIRDQVTVLLEVMSDTDLDPEDRKSTRLNSSH